MKTFIRLFAVVIAFTLFLSACQSKDNTSESAQKENTTLQAESNTELKSDKQSTDESNQDKIKIEY